jgi:hypothetical protein
MQRPISLPHPTRNNVRPAVGCVNQHIASLGQFAGFGAPRAIYDRQGLARADQCDRAVLQRQYRPVGFGHLVGVGGPDDDHSNGGAEIENHTVAMKDFCDVIHIGPVPSVRRIYVPFDDAQEQRLQRPSAITDSD